MKTIRLLLGILVCASGVLAGAQHEVLLPKRRAPSVAPAQPPPLPPGADDVTPATLDVVVRTRRQTITRTARRIHVMDDGREWLFEQNVRDPRRVAATLVDHLSRSVVFYAESDVRNMLGMNGWADVLTLAAYGDGEKAPGVTIERIRRSVDTGLLKSPAARYPDYRVCDLAEWLER